MVDVVGIATAISAKLMVRQMNYPTRAFAEKIDAGLVPIELLTLNFL